MDVVVFWYARISFFFLNNIRIHELPYHIETVERCWFTLFHYAFKYSDLMHFNSDDLSKIYTSIYLYVRFWDLFELNIIIVFRSANIFHQLLFVSPCFFFVFNFLAFSLVNKFDMLAAYLDIILVAWTGENSVGGERPYWFCAQHAYMLKDKVTMNNSFPDTNLCFLISMFTQVIALLDRIDFFWLWHQ
jgi:hypothetical protein